MAIYLDEVHVGNDPDLIGFPHLLLCMGLVLVTSDNMYGVHLTNIEYTNDTIDAFSGWLASVGVNGSAGRALYGSCNLQVRYGSNGNKARWVTEMTTIANKLGYRGDILGFDTSIISPKDGTYVEYRSDLNKPCKIYYKRHEKMDYGGFLHDGNVGKIKPDGSIRTDKGVTMRASADVVRTKSNKGNLHEVDYARRLMSFLL
ncbi:MAG: hypothetical protein WCC36_15910 [Gammaproteobacteria bacterium]